MSRAVILHARRACRDLLSGARGAAGCLAIAGALAACGADSATTPPPPPPPPSSDTFALRILADARGKRVGAAGDAGFRLTGSDGNQFRSVLAREYNLLTPENDMKFDHVHPAQGTFRYTGADSLVAFAEANNMKVRGHTLVWHQQLPSWLTNGTWTQNDVSLMLQDHIKQVVEHFKGHVVAWDVVNEALNDDGTLRSSFWSNYLGRGYIETAFTAAHLADPDAVLFYNDYNIEGVNQKSDSVYAMVQALKLRGVPIGGIGMQGHFQVNGVPSTLQQNMERFAALGLKVEITELDIRVSLPSTSASLNAQADDYRKVFQACLNVNACDAIITWGFTDRFSWVPSVFSGWGDALPFDAAYVHKPAYTAIYSLLK